MRRLTIAVLLAITAACHRSTPAVTPPAASTTTTFDSVVKREDPLPPDALRLPTKGDDPHNVPLVYGREGMDPGWVQMVAQIEAEEHHPEDDPFGFYRAAHSLSMRGGIAMGRVE